MRSKILLGTFLAIFILPVEARAHWCDDLWTSAYNFVVRPETDTVTLSASGTGTMNITVVNNMGYALPNFALTAKIGTTAVTATREAGKISGNNLYSGEKAKYTLAITKSGGGSVKIEDISFMVKFGNSSEANCYPGAGAQAVMVRKTDGTLVPAAPPPGLSTVTSPSGGCTPGGGDQARQLQYAAQTDFINVDAGLDKLMTYYCAGRASWNSGSDAVIATACSGTATDCTKGTRATGAGAGTKYDYPHLWAALELAVRKDSLGTRLAPLRQRLQCGAADSNVGFAGFAMMMLGYLGDDPGARTFLTGKVGTTDLGTIAKAALLLFGTAADKSTYEADVKAGLTKSTFVAAACAAALGIVELDDATVTSTLVPLAKWNEPDNSGENGQGIYAGHMLALVAWARRGWAAQAGDTGVVTFYEGGTPTPTGGSSGGAGAGGSTGAGGSPGRGGNTAVTGGSGGNTAVGGKTASASGGATPTGGNTAMATGGNTGTPSGGSGGRSTTNPVVGGSTDTGQTTGVGTGGSPGSSSTSQPSGSTGGDTGTGVGASTGSGAGGETGNSGAPSNLAAKSGGSAGGCGFVQSGRASIPLGFLLAGAGLAFAVRRRRR
jgi:MYXO-CTERM domain-containing protein